MLIGPAPEGGWAFVLQEDHAVMTGEIAESLGSDSIGGTPPRAVIDAAYGHEVGWRGERELVLNRDSGLPMSALEAPLNFHLPLQLDGPRLLGEESAEAGLLSSLKHLSRYEQPSPWALILKRHRLVRKYRAESIRLQDELRGRSSLAPELEPWCVGLVDFCDRLSHAMIKQRGNLAYELPLPDSKGAVKLSLNATGSRWTSEPWPFRKQSLGFSVSARILTRRFEDQVSLERAFSDAPVTTLFFEISSLPTGSLP